MKLCWRHQSRLAWAAWGSLLDLRGDSYPRVARVILNDARSCPRCREKLARTLLREIFK